MAIASKTISTTKTSVNISGGPSAASLINGSAARKFTTKDAVQNIIPNPVSVTSNAEHIISQAVGLKSVASVVEQAGKVAQIQLDSVKNALLATLTQVKTTTPAALISFNQTDLRVAQRSTADSIMQLLTKPAPHIQTQLALFAQTQVVNSVSTFLPPKKTEEVPVVFNTNVPEIDHISVDMSKKKGTTDCFFATIVFSLSLSQVSAGNVKAIKIFRSTIDDPIFSRDPSPLSMHGADTIMANKSRSRAKNQDYLSSFEHRLRENGTQNAVTNLIPVDPFTNLRTGAIQKTTNALSRPSSTPRPTNDGKSAATIGSFIAPGSFLQLDSSVSNDLNSMRNIQTQHPELSNFSPPNVVQVGRNIVTDKNMGNEALRQNRDDHKTSSPLVVDKNNSQDFKELAFLSPDKLSNRTIGDQIEFSFEDQSISFGKSYRYYILTVDKNMHESARSRLVEVPVDGLRIPDVPKSVTSRIIDNSVCLGMLVDDQLVEKFEIYRKDVSTGPNSIKTIDITHVSGRDGFTTQNEHQSRNSNGFIQIGESINGLVGGGSLFYDRHVISGRNYVYRVYSVDIFGNKSERPQEVAVYVPDFEHRLVDLQKPTIFVEVDASTGKARVTFRCDDPRVHALFLGRRDLTINQQAFVPPGEVSTIKLGFTDGAQGQSRFEDVHLGNQTRDIAWNGYFENDTRQRVFIDFTTTLDHTYQYRIFGVDKFGNMTQPEFSRRVFIWNRPMINAPVNLVGEVSFGLKAAVQGVKLDWDDGNLDITSEDRLGDRDKLNASAIRTVYQVERKRAGDDRWDEFPLTEQRTFFDAVQSTENNTAPNFRPNFLRVNETYLYRIKALQTGTFISNFSDTLEIFVDGPIKAPVNFRIRPCDTKVRPFYAMLNWDTDLASSVVDKWEIQKAEVNNFAAARLNSKNPSDFETLPYNPFRVVYAESSRFSARLSDSQENNLTGSQIERSGVTITGQHHFMDTNVQFGNSYFYRIRAISPQGTASDWAYKGIKITDETFEKKQEALITPVEKQILTVTQAPAVIKSNFLSPPAKASSFSLLTAFAQPVRPVVVQPAQKAVAAVTRQLATLNLRTLLR